MTTPTPLPQAVAALTAQAALLQSSWKFDNRACALRSMQKAIDAAGQSIVDIQGVWDARSNTWVPASPMAIVLERCTIVMAPVGEHHVAATTLTDEQHRAFLKEEGEHVEPEGDAESTLVLRTLPFCSFAAGLHVASFAVGTCAEGLLSCLEARFSDGGRLTLGAQGPQLQPASRRMAYPKAA